MKQLLYLYRKRSASQSLDSRDIRCYDNIQNLQSNIVPIVSAQGNNLRAFQNSWADEFHSVGLSPNLYAVQANKRVLSEENIEFKRSVFSVLSSEFLQKLQDHW